MDKSLERGYRPGIVLIDGAYGNNSSFIKGLEDRKLKYLGGVAKNRNVIITQEAGIESEIRLDKLAETLSSEDFTEVQLNLNRVC
ncbi:transposase [Microcystis sp. LEGE 08355]|nr:transposase [Microcystis sp. LEGE 08355]